MKERQILDVIETIYGATANSELWPEALARTTNLLGACCGSLHFVDHTSGEFEIRASAGYDIERALEKPFYHEWPKYDLWAERTVPHEPNGAVLVGTKYVPASEYQNSVVHNEFQLPFGDAWNWRDFIGIAPKLAGNTRAVFVAYRHAKQSDFGRAERDLMEILRPHVMVALQLDQRFGELKNLLAAMNETLDDRADAVLFLDRQGQVVAGNTRAQRMSEGIDSIIKMQAGRLHLRDFNQDRRFQRLLSSSLASDPKVEDAPVSNVALVWNDSSNGEKYSLRITPNLRLLGGRTFYLARTEPAAIVSISDFRPRADLIAARMRFTFDLTAAETTVLARIVAGARLSAICSENGVAMSTVRSQLKSVFQKTGVTSQSDLIRVALLGF